MTEQGRKVRVPARDGYELEATLYEPARDTNRLVVISSATAVPQRFYRHYAHALCEAGYRVLSYDYRGIAGSKPRSLRGFQATMRDWGLLDMAGVVDWCHQEYAPEKLFLVGHSVGGQIAGLLDNAHLIDGMMTFSAQSGYWGLQGKGQKLIVWLHVYLTLPVLSRLYGFMPWSKLTSAEDLPRDVALEWARWCRNRRYLLGDQSLPLERYQDFNAPVLAYSFGDDSWGTARSVDAMMSAYPNLERRHVEPEDVNVKSLGHFGYLRKSSEAHWQDGIAWLDAL